MHIRFYVLLHGGARQSINFAWFSLRLTVFRRTLLLKECRTNKKVQH